MFSKDKGSDKEFWQGEKRGEKRGRFENPEMVKEKPKSKVFLVVVGLAVLVLFVSGFVLLSSFLAVAMGEGWLHLIMAGLLVVCVPLALAFWAVRPMSGRLAFLWWCGVFSAPYVLALIGLCLGVPGRTSVVLNQHGAWLPRLVFGADDSKTRSFDRGMKRLAAVFGESDKGEQDVEDNVKSDEKSPEAAKTVTHDLVFGGKLLSSPEPLSIKQNDRKVRGVEVSVGVKGGVIIVRGKAGKGPGKPVTLALDPRSVRTVLSPEAVARLGVPILKDGPMEEVRLKGGKGRYPVVLLDMLALGKDKIRYLAAAVCGPCVHSGLSGQVGINYLKHFKFNIDKKREKLTLQRRKGRLNRVLDIEPFIDYAKMKGVWDSGVVKLSGRIGNRGVRRVSSLEVEALLLDEDGKVLARLSQNVRKLSPGHLVPISFQGPVDGSVVSFKLKVREGYW